MHVATSNHHGNPNIGLFLYATDKYCLVPHNTTEALKKDIEEILKVPTIEFGVAGTELMGVFLAGNEELLLVPKIIFDSEKRILEENDIDFEIVDTELTALGNNMVVSSDSIIINPDYDEEVVKALEKTFKVKKGKLAGLNTIGSHISIRDGHGLVSSDAERFEIKFVEDTFGIRLKQGTVNFGSPYISSGVVCNKNGFLIGEISGGPEVQNADEALGFIEWE